MSEPGHRDALDKGYHPGTIEQALYASWERAGYFTPSASGQPFCIMIPPPNVTGSLHMGHAFQDTLMDILTRYHRMQGCSTLWQGGTDHAGIATQLVVERQIEASGQHRLQLGRDAFLKEVFAWKDRSGGRITEQLRRLGASIDWARERFTMDAGLSRAVQEVFVRLYEEGLIYRGKRLVNWDPSLQTAVSDLEVTAEEEDGHLWHIRYPLVDGGHLVVATTRPETLLGDVAVAVHPEDSRYAALIGRQVRLPLADRLIPVIGDTYVDPDFGSGCVKITPAHDFNDYEVGIRHALPMITVLDATARIRLQGSPYDGLAREQARARMVADLEALGLLERTEAHRLKVPRGERSGVVIEPLLTDQWYVRTRPLADAAVKAVEDGRIRFVPENWAKTYFEWMRNIQDWCISRQIWWGHRIPAWYDESGAVYVGHSEQAVRDRHGLPETLRLRQDEDVLDTWFSSALWPFSTLGWPDASADLERFYPTDVLVTGFDIIFFWVARMIMMGLKFTGQVPFRRVYIHGLVRDAEGQKMSKSRGNVLDPIDLIDGIDLEDLVRKRVSGLMQPQMAQRIERQTRKQFPRGIPAFGVDALRFTFTSLASQGRNINFDLGRIEGYRNFCNKLWNATRYVLLNTEGHESNDGALDIDRSVPDLWIMSRLQETAREVRDALSDYRFDLASQAMYRFAWDEYCSWYLELAKIRLAMPGLSEAGARGTRRTLVDVLETLLRLLHPIVPFITETLWSALRPVSGKAGDTIMREPYPQPDEHALSPKAHDEIAWLMAVIEGIRTLRGEMGIAPGRMLPVHFSGGTATDAERVHQHRPYIEALARASSIEWAPGASIAPDSAIALVGSLRVFVPLPDAADKQAELSRLSKEIDKTLRDLERSQQKLSNRNFVERAPAPVIDEERRRVDTFARRLTQLEGQKARIESAGADN
ncbi:MAG: valine--tRNA ligase [Acidiferrobacteraceae bacterium]